MYKTMNATALLFLFAFTAGLMSPCLTYGQKRPNIVFILADDLGYSDLACYGNRFNETPHIDSLARQGMRFLQAYSSSPVCSPSRAGILTGKHPARLHLTNFLVGERIDSASPVRPAHWKKYLSPKETTLAEMLQTQQYTCGLVGKWHLGGADSLLPSAQGFSYERKIGENGLDYYNYTITSKNKTVFEDHGQHYLTDKLTDYSVEFIRANSKKPFFLFLTYSVPHVVLVPRGDKLRKYFFKYEKFNGACNPNYAAMLESMDDGVGRILQTLREMRLTDNTLVIFTSDNGGVGLPELGPTPTNLAPLRAWKGHVYEGGIRVPLIVKWPGKIKPGEVNNTPVSNIDFFPTFQQLLGIKHNGGIQDGKSMLANWINADAPVDERSFYWHYPHFSNQLGRPSAAVRHGDFKLVESYETGKIELFNLAGDIGEKNDLSSSHAAQADALLKDLRKWQKEVDANMPLPNPRRQQK
jgi:arylsulfatase A